MAKRIGLVTGLGDISPDASDLLFARLVDWLGDVNAACIRAGLRVPELYASGVTYAREATGSDDWIGFPAAIEWPSLDCEDLVAWRRGEIRAAGGKAWAEVRRQSRLLRHVVVRHADGTIEDPTRELNKRSRT